MQRIIANDEPMWKQALSNVKGVYAITDTSNGKLYIGSASGNNEGIWQRWAAYANEKNLTGGNKNIVDVLKQFGSNYIKKNFQYTILEIFDTKTKKEYILSRESYWQNALCSRKHGYN